MSKATRTADTDWILLSLGESIRAQRKLLEQSQETVANRVGLDRTYIASVEAGKRNVSIINLCRIAEGLGTTASDLLQNIERSAFRGK